MKVCTMEEYSGKADVILVCVKGYSLEETIPFIKRAAKKETVVIPILNIYGTGGQLQEKLADILVTDGCIYVSANIKEPGCLLWHGEILRVVFGVREEREYRPLLNTNQQEFQETGNSGILSPNIKTDA